MSFIVHVPVFDTFATSARTCKTGPFWFAAVIVTVVELVGVSGEGASLFGLFGVEVSGVSVCFMS